MGNFLFVLALVSFAHAELPKEAELGADIRFLKHEVMVMKELYKTEIETLKRRLAGYFCFKNLSFGHFTKSSVPFSFFCLFLLLVVQVQIHC